MLEKFKMFQIKHNTGRLKSLKIKDYGMNEPLVFCPECSFQLERGKECLPKCPYCGSNLHIISVTSELRSLQDV